MGSEDDADASGVDDDDTPAWPTHNPHPYISMLIIIYYYW